MTGGPHKALLQFLLPRGGVDFPTSDTEDEDALIVDPHAPGNLSAEMSSMMDYLAKKTSLHMRRRKRLAEM